MIKDYSHLPDRVSWGSESHNALNELAETYNCITKREFIKRHGHQRLNEVPEEAFVDVDGHPMICRNWYMDNVR